MTQATSAATSPVAKPIPLTTPVPLGQLLPWAVFGLLLAALLLYFVGFQQGVVHEFTHDGRHLLGFPCH